jgi:TonB-like protein
MKHFRKSMNHVSLPVLLIVFLLPVQGTLAASPIGPAPIIFGTTADAVHIEVHPLFQFPRDAALREREGWLLISAQLESDGRLHDLRVIDGANERSFRRDALAALRESRYSNLDAVLDDRDAVPVLIELVFDFEPCDPPQSKSRRANLSFFAQICGSPIQRVGMLHNPKFQPPPSTDPTESGR